MRIETDWPDLPAADFLSEPLVIHRVVENQDAATLVVFVHGLGGQRYGTWGLFPSLLLADVPSTHVGLYAYRTLTSRLKLAASIDLDLEAVVLADTLRDCPYERIIMIAHSMGGLLCKAAIKELIDRADVSTLARLKGLFLLATPQAGSGWAIPFMSWISKDMRALSPHGLLIERVHRTFVDRVSEKAGRSGKVHLPVFAVVASEDAWVSVLSSGLNIPSSNRKVVRGSHTRIVKPRSRDDDVYQWVLTRVQDLASRTEESGSNSQISGNALTQERLTQPPAVPVSKPVELTPKLISSIDGVYIAGNTKDARTVGETLIILVVTIQNTGDPTTVVGYRLEVDIPNRARPEFSLAKIPDTLKVPGRTVKDKSLAFYATDSLPDKTFSNPLTKDAPVRGIVVFISTSVTPPELYKPGVGLSLVFKDVKGLYYKMTMPSLNLSKPTGQSFVGLRSGPTGK
jgi:pimeloyl-ACP methyl ester carboxylesterase